MAPSTEGGRGLIVLLKPVPQLNHVNFYKQSSFDSGAGFPFCAHGRLNSNKLDHA